VLAQEAYHGGYAVLRGGAGIARRRPCQWPLAGKFYSDIDRPVMADSRRWLRIMAALILACASGPQSAAEGQQPSDPIQSLLM